MMIVTEMWAIISPVRSLVFLVLAGALGTESAQAETFDAVANFSGVENPGSVWSYNYSLDGITNGNVLLPTYNYIDNVRNAQVSDGSSTHYFKVWRQPSFNIDYDDAYLSLGANKSALDWTFVNAGLTGIVIPAHHIYVHPPRSGSVVLTFTSPRAMVGTVNYSFTHADCTGAYFLGIHFAVKQVRQALYRPFVATIASGSEVSSSCSALATSGERRARIVLNAGDQVNFVVRPNDTGSNGHDSTVITASIVAN